MKLNVFVFRNSVLGCSGNPIYDDHEPDVFAKQLERVIITASAEKIAQYENTSLYFIGCYDDETLRFESVKDPVLLLDLNQVLEDRKVKYEILKKVQEMRKEKESDGKKD